MYCMQCEVLALAFLFPNLIFMFLTDRVPMSLRRIRAFI